MKSFPSEKVSIVGAYESPRRVAPGIHPFQIHAEVIKGALDDAGLTIDDVDGYATASSFPQECGMQQNVVELTEYVGLKPRWFDSTDIGGPSYMSHVGHAVAAIESGLCNVVVVSHAQCGRNSLLPGYDYNHSPTGPGQYEVPYGPSTVASYALAATRYMHDYDATSEHLAKIAVQCRANAALNPDARYRDPITVDDVLSSAMIATPLRKFDCCVVTDSGGAVVVTSTERAKDLRSKPVKVLGFGEAIGQMSMNQMEDFTTTVATHSGKRAFESAGLSPSDIDVAQIYDSFTITVALSLEALGFVGRGEVAGFIDDGHISPTGCLPINTDGGGLSSNHTGRRGMFAMIEAVRQLRGDAPGVQLDNPQTGLVTGTGGSLSATSTMIMGR